jgi:hypothetical protein
MRFSSKIVLRVAAIGVAAAAIGLPATAAQAHTSVTTPATGTVTVVPNTAVTDGESLAVTGSGFADSENYAIVECSSPTDPLSCDESAPVTGQTTAGGAISATFKAEEGFVGNGFCVSASTCFIEAISYTTNPQAPDTAGGAPITFATDLTPTLTVQPSTGLTNGQTVKVTGSAFAANKTSSTDDSLVQCSSLSATGCKKTSDVPFTTDGNGFFHATFVVHTGTIGDGTCAAGSSSCDLLATTDASNPSDVAAVGFHSIAFAAVVKPPTAKATPNSGLKNKQTVTISGAHFPQHNSKLYLIECNSNLLKTGPTGGSSACDTGTINLNTPYRTSSTGTVKGAKIKVETGTVGDGKCGVGHPCFIAVTTSLNGATADSAAAPISFGTAKSKTTAKASAKKVKSGKTFTISGAVKSAGKGVVGARVVLYERAKGKKAWHKVKGYATKAGGKFKTGKLKGPKKTEQYLVKHPKGSAGGFSYGASQSKIITVKK